MSISGACATIFHMDTHPNKARLGAWSHTFQLVTSTHRGFNPAYKLLEELDKEQPRPHDGDMAKYVQQEFEKRFFPSNPSVMDVPLRTVDMDHARLPWIEHLNSKIICTNDMTRKQLS